MNIQEKLSTLSNQELEVLSNIVISWSTKGFIPLHPLVESLQRQVYPNEPAKIFNIATDVLKEVLSRNGNVSLSEVPPIVDTNKVKVTILFKEKGDGPLFDSDLARKRFYYTNNWKREILLPLSAIPSEEESFSVIWTDSKTSDLLHDREKPFKKMTGEVRTVQRNYDMQSGELKVKISLIYPMYEQSKSDFD